MNEPDELPPADLFDEDGEALEDTPEIGEEEGQMSFLDHLEDLRWTLFKSFCAFGLACIVVGLFLAQFSDLLRWPYEFALSGRNLEMSGLINTSILGVFSVIFYLLLGGGMALSLPFIMYFVGQFVAPGLNERELKLLPARWLSCCSWPAYRSVSLSSSRPPSGHPSSSTSCLASRRCGPRPAITV